MKNTLLIFIIFLFIANNCYASIIIGGESSKPIIMCLGDSITVGAGDEEQTSGEFGYRDHLQDLLGVGNYLFVGPFTDPDTDEVYDVNHGGVGGQTASSISSRLNSYLTTYFNNNLASGSAILIMAGTNDCNQSVPNNTTIAHISNMVSKIDSHNPDIDVYVAKVTPTHTSGAGITINACLSTLNPLIESTILARQATKSNVHVVDMNAAFRANTNWETDYLSGVGVSHPKDAGYQIMANTWYSCIQNPTNTYCDGN